MNRHRSPYWGLGLDRLQIFVPAIMSVGFAFWLATLLRDMVLWRQTETLERRAIIAGRRTSRLVRSSGEHPRPEHIGLRHRPAYLVTAVALGALASYIFTGSLLNYLRADGYIEGAAWILALATLAAGSFVVTAVAALLTYVRWPDPPRWVWEIHAVSPLARVPIDRADPDLEPDWRLSAAALLLPTVTIAGFFLVATDWRWVNWLDEQLADGIESIGRLDMLAVFDPLGSPVVAVAAAAAVAVAALRCRPLAVGYPVAVVVALVVTATTRNLVPRARPVDGPLAGMTDSFPSDQTALATLMAGLLPLGMAALFASRRPIWPLRIVLGLGVVAGAIHQVESLEHNPSDVIAGALIGLSLVVAVEWIIDHTGWHRWCRGCVWAPESHGPPVLGVVDLHASSQRLIRLVAHLWAAASVVMLTVLTVVYGVPTDPGEGAIFGPHIQQPVQLALALLASIGAVLSWKWDALGAVILAVAGAGLAVFSAIEYPPRVAIGLALMFIVPAVLLWLGWQHRRTMAEIIGLATGTAVLLGATSLGVVAVHDFYFGSTHPDSDAVFLDVDEVTWAWVGGVLADRAVVSAGFDDEPDGDVTAVATPSDGGTTVRATVGAEDAMPSARFELTGLEPDTDYRYVIETEGVPDTSRGRGRFRTAPTGASSFRVAVGACARTDSNGAVFDAIAADDPLFFLQIGDIHYGNIESPDPADYRMAYERMLARPGQAAFYRDVPLAHVWDDHDYGPNDSDATSKGRDAARQAYRDTVPHHDLVNGPGGPIQHAFTVGRVRFVLTDTRSEKTDDTMLGDEQVEWLIDEVARSSRTHALVVWANPVPWIAEAKEGADHWAGYPAERRRIADGFAEAGVDNLVMVSGDAHMLALDDGTNSDYSTDGVGGFPVLHAAALDRPGGEKGGPFSHGRFGGAGQYGLLDVRDDGESVTVTLTGVDWRGEVIVEEDFTFAVD